MILLSLYRIKESFTNRLNYFQKQKSHSSILWKMRFLVKCPLSSASALGNDLALDVLTYTFYLSQIFPFIRVLHNFTKSRNNLLSVFIYILLVYFVYHSILPNSLHISAVHICTKWCRISYLICFLSFFFAL